MVRIMRKLPVYGFHYRMPLIPDVNDLVQVFGLQGVQGLKEAGPAFVPFANKFYPAFYIVLKFRIPVAPGFLPSEVKKSVQRESMFPQRCFTMVAMLLLSSLYCQNKWSSCNWAKVL